MAGKDFKTYLIIDSNAQVGSYEGRVWVLPGAHYVERKGAQVVSISMSYYNSVAYQRPNVIVGTSSRDLQLAAARIDISDPFPVGFDIDKLAYAEALARISASAIGSTSREDYEIGDDPYMYEMGGEAPEEGLVWANPPPLAALRAFPTVITTGEPGREFSFLGNPLTGVVVLVFVPRGTRFKFRKLDYHTFIDMDAPVPYVHTSTILKTTVRSYWDVGQGGLTKAGLRMIYYRPPPIRVEDSLDGDTSSSPPPAKKARPGTSSQPDELF